MDKVLRCARNPVILLALLTMAPTSAPPPATRWQAQAARVTITRDDWGIPHIQGQTDADAVFGLMYAQAEDDFPRIEANYLAALGRTAEAYGPWFATIVAAGKAPHSGAASTGHGQPVPAPLTSRYIRIARADRSRRAGPVPSN